MIANQIVGGAVMLLISLMVFNTLGMADAANSGSSNLNLTISAGTLEIVNVGTSVQFSAGTAGTASNEFQNLDGSTVRDFRGGSNWDWDLNAYSQPLTGVTDTNYLISNTSLSLWPGNATKVNVETYVNTNLGNGVGTRALNGDNIFFNSENGRAGAVRLDTALFKVNMNASLIAQDYRGNVTLTVIAS